MAGRVVYSDRKQNLQVVRFNLNLGYGSLSTYE